MADKQGSGMQQECMYLVTCRQRHRRDRCGDGEVKVAHGLNACGNQGILQAPHSWNCWSKTEKFAASGPR